jgi:hypothetical protein
MTPQRLWERAVRRPNGCLIWTGARNDSGYGSVKVGGRVLKAHRYAYEVATGKPIPEGMDIGHQCHDDDLDCPPGKCEHRLCIEPTHLLPQTIDENRHELVAKRNARIRERLAA